MTLFAALVAGALTLGASPARADDLEKSIEVVPTKIDEAPPAGFSNWDEVWDIQQRMAFALEAIRSAAAQVKDPGYGSAVAAPENRELRVYWKGTLPDPVKAVVARERARIPISILPAKFTEAQLLRDTATLAADPAFYQVGPLPDASGLQVLTLRGSGLSASARVSASKVQSSVVFAGETAGRKFISRQDDASPYWSGARTTNCTTGFSILHGGRNKLLFAAHCAANGTTIRDGGGQNIGVVTNRNVTRDTSIIDADSRGRMWDGGVNSTFSKAVQGSQASAVGNSACQSGSHSGVRCGIRVTAINQFVGGDGPLTFAEKVDGTNAVGGGDSGGPVFSLPSPDNGNVWAKGINSAGHVGTEVPCTGLGGRTCYSRFDYLDVTQTLAFYGAQLTLG